jgi:hypothetical protein
MFGRCEDNPLLAAGLATLLVKQRNEEDSNKRTHQKRKKEKVVVCVQCVRNHCHNDKCPSLCMHGFEGNYT